MTARDRWILAATVLALTALTVVAQEQALGLDYLRENQMSRHRQILDNTAPNPWQYRVFSAWVLEGMLIAARVIGVPDAAVVTQLALRLFQNATLFVLAALFYRRLGLRPPAVVVGLMLLGWPMCTMFYDSDLSFNVYFDAIIYLSGAILILAGRPLLLLPLMVVGALNRETVALLPALLLAHASLATPFRALWRSHEFRIAVALGLIWLGIYVGLRVHFGVRPWSVWGLEPAGLPMLIHNLSNPYRMLRVALTLSVLPLLGAVYLRALPPVLQAFGVVLVPIWFVVHFSMVIVDETRIFLVPLVLVLAPAALCLAAGERRQATPGAL